MIFLKPFPCNHYCGYIFIILQGEVTHFVKEFEAKRGDQEVENLFKTFEVTTELQSTEVNKLTTTCDEQFPTVNANLLVAQSMCNKILDQAKNSELVNTPNILLEPETEENFCP